MSDSDLLANLHSGTWLDAQEFPPLEWAVPGLMPEGYSLHVGAPKIGKSWMLLAHALAVAAGGFALGRIDVGPPRPVLYAALEDGDRRLQERCRRLLEGQPIPALLDYVTRVEHGQVLATIGAWLELHGTMRPLVVLDTLGKVMPPALQGETPYGRDYRIGSALHLVADQYPGMALVVNHHDRKLAADDFVDAVSGTHGLAGAADTIIVLARDRQETAGLLSVTGRDVPENTYALEFRNGHRWELDGDDLVAAADRAQMVKATTRATGSIGDRMIDVVMLAYAHPEGIRRGDVAKALDISPDVAGVCLARLVASGRLRRTGRGLYTPVPAAGAHVDPVTSVTSGEQGALDPQQHNERNTPLVGGDDV